MAEIFPFRVRFEKVGRPRFLSHHDLMRLFERAVRRSGLPIRMTEGFNPHPILSFPTALGVGIESLDEVMELELSTWVAPAQIRERLAAQLPEGMAVRSVEPFRRRDRSFVDFIEFEIEGCPLPGDFAGRVAAFFAAKEHVVTRHLGNRKKTVDIRPYVMAVESEEGKLFIRIRVTDSGSARPEEVLEAVGVAADAGARVRKTYTELGVR